MEVKTSTPPRSRRVLVMSSRAALHALRDTERPHQAPAATARAVLEVAGWELHGRAGRHRAWATMWILCTLALAVASYVLGWLGNTGEGYAWCMTAGAGLVALHEVILWRELRSAGYAMSGAELE